MARNRKTYRGQTPPHFSGARRNPEDEDFPGEPQPPPPPQPQAKKSTTLRTILTIAGGAIIGAVAVDLYRKYMPSRNAGPDRDETAPALPAAPSTSAPQIMPMPMPFPMPMPAFGPSPFQNTPPDRPLTGPEKLELARLKKEQAELEAGAAEMRAWEAGEID